MSHPEMPESGMAHNPDPGAEPLSPEKARQKAAEIKERLADSLAKRQLDLANKIKDREELLRKYQEAHNNLSEAQAAADEVRIALDAAGDLATEEDRRSYEELQQILNDLQEQENEIARRIEALSADPAVHDQLVDQAEDMKKEREADELRENAKAELLEQADQLANKIKELAQELHDVWKSHQEFGQTASRMKSEVKEWISQQAAEKGLDNFSDLLIHQFEDHSKEEFLTKLEKIKQARGIFKFKERKLIAIVIDAATNDELFNAYYDSQKNQRQALSERRRIDREEIPVLVQEYRSLSDAVQSKADEIAELTATKNLGPFPYDVYSRIVGRLKEFAANKAIVDWLDYIWRDIQKND